MSSSDPYLLGSHAGAPIMSWTAPHFADVIMVELHYLMTRFTVRCDVVAGSQCRQQGCPSILLLTLLTSSRLCSSPDHRSFMLLLFFSIFGCQYKCTGSSAPSPSFMGAHAKAHQCATAFAVFSQDPSHSMAGYEDHITSLSTTTSVHSLAEMAHHRGPPCSLSSLYLCAASPPGHCCLVGGRFQSTTSGDFMPCSA